MHDSKAFYASKTWTLAIAPFFGANCVCPGLLSQWEHVFLKTITNRQKKIKANTKRETTQVEGKTAVNYRLGIFVRGGGKTETPTSEKN